MTLGTNLRDLTDWKHNLVVEGPDFVKREERRTNGEDIFIGMIVTGENETFPDIDPCAEDEMPLGIVEGYTNKDEVNGTYGYWYQDGDVPFGDNKWVIVATLTPGQIIWVCSASNTTIAQGNGLKVVDGLMALASTGDDIIMKAAEAITGVSSTTQYFRATVVKS